jgi:hypothetical protein
MVGIGVTGVLHSANPVPQRFLTPSGRPKPGEYAAYMERAVAAVAGDDAIAALRAVATDTQTLAGAWSDALVLGVRYAPEKWTIKDVLGHLVDDERVFAYRVLCLARGESAALPGFDENVYARNASAESRPLAAILEDYTAVRAATIALCAGLDRPGWTRAGVVNGYRATARGLAFHIVAHERHHLRLLRERYVPLLSGTTAP